MVNKQVVKITLTKDRPFKVVEGIVIKRDREYHALKWEIIRSTPEPKEIRQKNVIYFRNGTGNADFKGAQYTKNYFTVLKVGMLPLKVTEQKEIVYPEEITLKITLEEKPPTTEKSTSWGSRLWAWLWGED